MKTIKLNELYLARGHLYSIERNNAMSYKIHNTDSNSFVCICKDLNEAITILKGMEEAK